MKEIIRYMEILQAPEGFTGKVMNRVSAEPRHSGISYQPLISPVVWLVIFALFIALIVVAYLFSGTASDASTLYGIQINLQPVFDWLREVFESIGKINASPAILYLSILTLLLLVLIDEFILKNIYQRL